MHVSLRIKGHLDPDLWQEWLEGLEIMREEGGASRLRGTLADQAALYGVLNKIHRLSLTLLSLESSETEPEQDCCLSPTITLKNEQNHEGEKP